MSQPTPRETAQSLSAQINTRLRVNIDEDFPRQLAVLGALIGEIEITMNALREVQL
tara:strand:- start:1409 stop:1576 length:168 start_codon:yes stop_codon:yes gene_type:complete